jgi:cobyrinic acid a,c-diamide synthase
MTPEVCREVLVRSASHSDLALIEGRYDCALRADRPGADRKSADQPKVDQPKVDQPSADQPGGRLDPLCDWLWLPRLAVLDVSRLGDCRIAPRPGGIDALLLDGFADESEFCRLQTNLETLWGIPVLGGLSRLSSARCVLANLPAGSTPPANLLRFLGDDFERTARIDRIRNLAARRAWPEAPEPVCHRGEGVAEVRVAVAYDAAFHCYFPDTLDLLEMRGASVVDFSPLKDDVLPPETDIVYLGCGHPERFAQELANNYCMTMALRNHVCEGRRIYAEGGGLAYLCRSVVAADGRHLPMTGILPAVARQNDKPWIPEPVEATVAAENWLAPLGTRLRGYLNQSWFLEPASDLAGYLEGAQFNLAGRHHAIGSRIHLNFAALPEAFRSFLKPHAASLDLAGCRCPHR